MLQAKAILTTRWGKAGYRPLTVVTVEGFHVDSALDQDADTWQLEVGNPDNSLNAALRRDNEVRASIYIIEDGNTAALQKGFADEISMTAQGTLILSGRDISAVAVDSAAPPGRFRGIRPEQLVAREARKLNIGDRLKLKRGPSLGFFMRDGSETYWESWYRFYRRRRMWMWAEPDGTLRADFLNYDDPPSYKFGSPRLLRSGKRDKGYIPVESIEFRKSTAQRIGEVWVLGEHAKKPFIAKAVDRTTSDWIKRPRKIMEAARARGPSEARHEAWTEVHESKVGALEIVMQVSDPGYLIRQNRNAIVNIPEAGIGGTWFIVGVKSMGSVAEGLSQEVRLREKGYAISRKIPADPTVPEEPGDAAANDMGDTNLGGGIKWGDAFVKAAKEFHGAWDFNLWLACFLAMCEKESGFTNRREGGSIEWYDVKATQDNRKERKYADDPAYGGANRSAETDRHHKLFANNPGNPLNPYGRDAGVGPMQLTTHGYKVWADEYFGKSDEYVGGRWHPTSNIRAAARAFASKLSGIPPNPQTNIYLGVMAYNGAGSRARAYAADVRKKVEDKYLEIVTSSREKSSGKVVLTTPPKYPKRVDPDNFKDLPSDVGQRASCGWPKVHPDFYTVMVQVSRKFGCRIVNGYRSEACNRKVGGAKYSDHMCGVAGDYVGSANQMAELARWANKQGYAMVIYGPLKIGPAANWEGHMDHVHISFVRCASLK